MSRKEAVLMCGYGMGGAFLIGRSNAPSWFHDLVNPGIATALELATTIVGIIMIVRAGRWMVKNIIEIGKST